MSIAFIIKVNVTDQSSSEIFTSKNKIVYASPTAHVSNKLTRAKYGY